MSIRIMMITITSHIDKITYPSDNLPVIVKYIHDTYQHVTSNNYINIKYSAEFYLFKLRFIQSSFFSIIITGACCFARDAG